jgi:hypothetical protein
MSDLTFLLIFISFFVIVYSVLDFLVESDERKNNVK